MQTCVMPLFSRCTRTLSADHVPSGRVPIACPSKGSDANDALQTRHAQKTAALQLCGISGIAHTSLLKVMLQPRHALCIAAPDRLC